MFVRVKKIGPYEYLYLVENVREGGRHVQRVIKALGRRDVIENSDLLDGLIASAARHSRRTIVLSSSSRGELPELRRRAIGPDLIFSRLWIETGCRDVLHNLLRDRDFGFDVERAIYLTVLHRLIVSGSDRHAHDWHQRLRIPGAEALTLKQAYKAMAWLGEDTADKRPMTELIEEALYRHRQPLFSELSVAFFDTTSLYFEGHGGATLGQRGFSKDYRPQLHQVVLGIVLDGQDRPIASFLWLGNTADVTTLLPVVERLCTRFGIGRACIVADRGMISAATIAGLEAQGIDYILGGASARPLRFAARSLRMMASRCRSPSRARRARPISPSRRSFWPDGATCSAATRNRLARMPRPARVCWPDWSASWRRVTRHWLATPAIGACWSVPRVRGSPSIPPKSRPMRSSTGSSSCAPIPG